MAKVGEFRIEGVNELAAGLRSLPRQVQRSGLRKAVTAGTSPIVKAAKQEAPQQSKLLKKSLGKKVKTYTRTNTVVGIIGPRAEVEGEYKGRRRIPVFYAHLVEEGHAGPRPARPRHFLRRAFDATKGAALRVMSATIGDFVLAAAARLARRGK